jgi:hypothetical protein
MDATIICPTCRQALRLPPQLEVLREVHKGGGSFVAFGDPDQKLPCPYCPTTLRVRDILDGKYDPPRAKGGGILEVIFALGLLVGIVALFRSC